MPRRLFASVPLLVVATSFLAPPALFAQAKDEKKDEKKDDAKKDDAKKDEKKDETKVDSKDVTFNTADGVEIQGTLYKSVKSPGDSPVVILLHSFGKDPNKGDWTGLAQTLARKNFNVLKFDFRGHGKSTVIDPKVFWDNPANVAAFPALARKKPLPNRLEMKDIQGAKATYFPHLVNDIMAARIDLDKKNDGTEVNTGSVYLVGATDAATLGMLYMTAEWTRPQVMGVITGNLVTLPPDRRQVPPNSDMAGKDIAGAVWLSPVRHQSVDSDVMKKWVSLYSTDVREKNPVLSLYGDGDTAGAKVSKFLCDEVLIAKSRDKKLNDLKFTVARDIKGTKNVGVDLLGNNLSTEETIVNYLTTLEQDRKNVTRTPNRGYTKPPLVLTQLFGVR